MKKTLLLAFIFLSLGFVSTAQEIIFSEDFEGGALPVGWSIVTKATDGGYVIGTTADISSQSFVIPDHGKFAGTNDDKCNCNKSDDQLKTGVMDLSTYTTLFLQFDSYYLKSAYQGVSESLFLDLSTDGGVTWTAMPLNTAFGNKWVEANQVDVSAIAGSPTAMIRFRYNDGGGWLYGAGFDNISLYQPADYDIKMLAISPTNKDKCFFGAEETVKITIKNIGLYAASGFDIKYTLYLPDGSEVEVIEPVFDVVEPNQTITLTFDTKADMSAAGAYSIVAEVIYGDDWVPENNVLQVDMEFTSGEVKLTGTGSNYGDQLWKLYTIAGDLVATGGDWAKNLPFSEVACVSDAVCYYMTYEAASGSGATAANPNFKITYNGNVIFIPDAIVDPGYVVPIHRDFKIFAIGSACPAINAALSNVFIPAIIKLNSPQQIEGTVTNQGRDTLHSFDVTYTIDGGVPKVQTFNVDLAPSRSLTFTHDSAVVITSGFTKRDLLVEVDNFNGGEPDADLSDNSASLKFDVVEELADKRVVFEEATGTWCQWCPRGAVYLEKVTSENPESAIGIAIHNGDPMTVTAWDAMMGQYIGGYPSGLADRRLNNIDPLEFPDALPRILKYYPAIASVETNATFDQATRELNIQVSANMIIDNTGEYRLNAFIVEDGLKGTTSGWAQVNAYSGGANGAMGGYENLPSPVPAAQMVYNHVGRAVLGTVWGDEATVPTTQQRGDTYNHSYTFTVPAGWNEHNMKVVGVMQQWNETDIQARGFVNAIEVEPTIISSTTDPKLNATLNIYPNPATEKLFVEFSLESSESMKIQLTNLVGQIVYVDQTNYPSGANRAWINTNKLANGSYFMTITGKNGIATRKVTVAN